MLQSRFSLIVYLIALFTSLQLSCPSLSAQPTPENLVISINDGYLSINGMQAEMPESLEWWVERLGPYSRNSEGNRRSYIWDDLGISILQNYPENPYNIILEFRDIETNSFPSGRRGRDAIKNFPGTFIFKGIALDETVPLYEYNHKYRQLGGKKRHFYESSRSIVDRFTGLMFPGTKKTFGVSARVGADNCIYRLEFSYGEWDRWPTESERERFSTR